MDVAFKCFILHVFYTVWRVNERRSDGDMTWALENGSRRDGGQRSGRDGGG
jgi:hypothetical protein